MTENSPLSSIAFHNFWMNMIHKHYVNIFVVGFIFMII